MAQKATRGAATKDVMESNLISIVREATQLLKFGRGGKPGFRHFQLSGDLLSLTWTSKNKAAAKTRILLSDVREIMYGQRTEKFKRNNRPDLEHLSFSLIYYDRDNASAGNTTNNTGLIDGFSQGDNGPIIETLDVVCKDEAEFQLWTTTLSALVENKIDRNLYLPATLPYMDKVGTTPLTKKKSKVARVVPRDAFKDANDVYAFGWGEWGQNGVDVVEMDAVTTPKLVETLLGKHVVQVSCGWSHSTVLLDTGVIFQSGNRVGTGCNDDVFLPLEIPMSEKRSILSVSCGHFHSAALTDAGHVLTWGCNLNGQLGHGDFRDVREPRVVSALLSSPMGLETFVTQVVCGGAFTAALTDDNQVYTWGCGDHGSLGIDDINDQNKPVIVKDLMGTDITKIAAGDAHMFACTGRETYAWGWNACGQLGLGHEEDQVRPHVVELFRGNDVKDIACGAAHSVAIVYMVKFKTDVIFSWGSNCVGQLGQGKKSKLPRPSPIPEFKCDSPFVEVRCGAFHTLLRTEKGEVYSTGLNKYGQLGHGVTKDDDEFRLIDFLKDKNCRSIAAGGHNTAVLTARAWVEDSEAKECMSCKQGFTFVNRKHHCRNCGGIFCNNCSSKKMALLKFNVTEPVRVCDNCYVMLGGRK